MRAWLAARPGAVAVRPRARGRVGHGRARLVTTLAVAKPFPLLAERTVKLPLNYYQARGRAPCDGVPRRREGGGRRTRFPLSPWWNSRLGFKLFSSHGEQLSLVLGVVAAQYWPGGRRICLWRPARRALSRPRRPPPPSPPSSSDPGGPEHVEAHSDHPRRGDAHRRRARRRLQRRRTGRSRGNSLRRGGVLGGHGAPRRL